MKIFIDSDYKCYTTSAEGRREFDAEFFDGKCTAFVEGYRYMPTGEMWTRADGTVFAGEMISPWKGYSALATAQEAYKQGRKESAEEIADMQGALNVMGVAVNE